MSKLPSSLLIAIVVSMISFSISAQVKGRGEVKGEVMSSWLSGEQVRFRLSIINQQSWSGSRLANPNNFVYSGADKMRITEGDKVTLIYNSSDGDYFVAQSLEFNEDRPGEIDQTSYLFPVTIAVIFLVVILVIILFVRRKQRALHTT